MVDAAGGGGLAGDVSDGDDDIARFERQCAERCRAEGLPAPGADDDDDELRSDDNGGDDRPGPMPGGGPSPRSGEDWQQKCRALQAKLSKREAELSQARGDVEILRSQTSSSSADPGSDLKQKLLELNKKNRRLQVTTESQKSRLQQLEAELKKPREEVRRQAEEAAMQSAGALLGDGMEDWKKKYLAASNKLQEVRHEVQELRAQAQRQKKVLLKEVGSEDQIEKALAVADDPNAVQWKGRAAQISQLQRQVKELREGMKRASGVPEDTDMGIETIEAETPPRPQQRARPEQVGDKERAALALAADRRREEFERLQSEAERLRTEQAEAKRKRDAMKSRNAILEEQLRELKSSVQDLLRKSENDDALVEALRRQLGRTGPVSGEGAAVGAGAASEVDGLRQQNSELQAQVERQAQIVLQLRQKNLASSCENGSVRLGPKSVEGSTSERQLVERVRFLEAETAKQNEQIRLQREQLGDDMDTSGRPFSAGSLSLKEKLRQMGERLAVAERENQRLRQHTEEYQPDSSPSCRSSRSNSRGHRGGGFGARTGDSGTE